MVQLSRQLGVLMFLSMLLCSSVRGSPYDAMFTSARTHPIVALHTWSPANGLVLHCAIVAPSRDSGPSEGTLKIFSRGQEVFSARPYAVHVALFSTSEREPHLTAIWINGSGVYSVQVFAYQGGKVVKVLEAFSKMMPEFAYAGDKAGSHRQQIIISKLGWVLDRKSGESVQQPVTADVYYWDKNAYAVRRDVRWGSRFEDRPAMDQEP